jgi:hypothetical protein
VHLDSHLIQEQNNIFYLFIVRYEFQSGTGGGNLPHVHGLVTCDRSTGLPDEFFANKITCCRDDLADPGLGFDFNTMTKKKGTIIISCILLCIYELLHL